MSGLVKSEFRKIFTVNLWWALLIPIALLSFLAGTFGSAVGTVSELEQQLGRSLPLGLLTVSMATNFSTIFAAIFGALSFANEHGNKSITTTYLTGNPRGAVMGAKLIVYVNMGLLFGLVNVLCASLGGLIGAGFDGFGNAVDWFSVGAAGLLSMVLWTLLGVGLGALITQPALVIILLVAYKFVFEAILNTFLVGSDAAAVNAYLPASAGSGLVGNLAVPIFVSATAGSNEANVPQQVFELLHFFFGGTYGHPWWASLLTFMAYTALFVCGGWLVSRQRDIT